MEALDVTGFWLDRPVFVTGATGLVGGWLVKELVNRGGDVVCLVRDWVPGSKLVRSRLTDQVKIVRGDTCDSQVIERVLGEYEIDTVIHLAAQTIVPIANRNPSSTFETNVRGTWTVLEACRRSPTVKQIVLASSDKAYGDQGLSACDEGASLNGRYPYDVSKVCADLIGQTFATTYGLPVAITRCGNFYGGGDLNWNRIVPGTIRSILRGQRPVVRSDGQFVRDYFYVEDGVAAYLLLTEKLAGNPELRGHAFNFSNEAAMPALDVVRRVLAVMDSNLEPDVRNVVSNEIRFQSLNATKARERLGWHPLFSLDDGLRRTASWYEAYFKLSCRD